MVVIDVEGQNSCRTGFPEDCRTQVCSCAVETFSALYGGHTVKKFKLDFPRKSAYFFHPFLVRFFSTMAIRVVEFSNGGYKIRKIFA